MKVKAFCINRGTNSEHYKLYSAEENHVLYYQPARGWKTEAGALRWAKNHGFEVEKNQA